MSSYGQYCPVAKSMEVLDERWTMLVIRELIAGSKHFNEVRRGVPKMSPTLLSKRLRSLERAGIVRRFADGQKVTYELTPMGRELQDIVMGLGAWGTRWIGEMGEQDLDPHLLFWEIQRDMDPTRWPSGRTVLAFELDGVDPGARRWWIVGSPEDVDICDFDPGFEVSVRIHGPLSTLVRHWRGDITWAQALKNGDLDVTGPASIRRRVPELIGQSVFAATPRP
jgi:DNA-binding HxlR family transcriptional regulator